MPADNVDIFKKIIFRIPSTKKILAALTLLGLVYSFLFFLALQAFAGNLIQLSGLGPGFVAAVWLLALTAPSVASGELLHMLLPDYPRNWGYFLAGCNQAILFLFLLVFSGANNVANAWNVIWLATTTLFLGNFFVLLVTLGYSHVKRIGALSAVHPVLVLVSFQLLLGPHIAIPPQVYILNLGIILLAGLILLAVFGVAEYLLRSNVSNVSVLKLTSALFQKEQEKLDLGYPSKPTVQSLGVENQNKVQLSVPWIHPGPLEGFGGGQVTSDIIESLNEQGTGFFLHVPSTHKSDPADPGDYQKIVAAMEEPDKHGQASKLVEKEYSNAVFYGRRIDGKNLVFMDMDYDDAEISIFRDIIDPEETLLVDLHSHERAQKASSREELWDNTLEAERLRNSLLDFIQLLESQQLHDYRAGFAVDVKETPVFSLVEKVDGQETLLFGIEGNEASPELLDLEQRYRKEFDQVLLFTTDTHQSIHDLSSRKQVDADRVIENVENAVENVSDAEIGFTAGEADVMKLLREDYSSLIFSINILVRLIPLSLLLLYLGLVLWLF